MNPRDEAARDNLGLVHACCKRFRGRGIEYEELYSAGCLGLVKALNRFNPELGLQFSTYAVPVILGEIRALFRSGGAVKVSRSIKELSLKISRESAAFEAENGREPTVGELSDRLDTTPEKVNEALGASRLPMSLTGESEGEEREFDLPCEDMTERLTEKLALREEILLLSPEDRSLIILRYYRHKTQTETASILRLTQVQVSRREKKILGKLRERISNE